MSSAAFSLILDFILLAGLGVTLFYAYRLTKSLDNFKKYRDEFGQVIQDLGHNIEEAQKAIENLKETTASSGEELDQRLKDATMLADELQLMSDAGNSLATRLEKLAEKNRMIAQGFDSYVGDTDISTGEDKVKDIASKTPGGFAIQDRDYDDDEDLFDDDYDEADVSGLQSQAEKDLMQAIQNKKKQSAGNV